MERLWVPGASVGLSTALPDVSSVALSNCTAPSHSVTLPVGGHGPIVEQTTGYAAATLTATVSPRLVHSVKVDGTITIDAGVGPLPVSCSTAEEAAGIVALPEYEATMNCKPEPPMATSESETVAASEPNAVISSLPLLSPNARSAKPSSFRSNNRKFGFKPLGGEKVSTGANVPGELALPEFTAAIRVAPKRSVTVPNENISGIPFALRGPTASPSGVYRLEAVAVHGYSATGRNWPG